VSDTISIVGTLGREPELRYTAGGQAMCTFSVAVTRKWKDNAGEAKEQTSWFDVTAWREMAEHVAASLGKGSRVIVVGRPETREWEDKDTGKKRTAFQIVADAIGPDLRFAQVQVEKVQRDKPQARPSDPIFGDEEPF
jgi:single-strand DNA-binding protein